jgi:ABC-2 type transport system ATP-binding protein
MPCILVSGLEKTYRTSLRGHGLAGALKGLVRRDYREVAALRNVSFTVEAGEILGYIGPNGAGKSTTIKIMSGIMRPDAGECLVAGMVPWKNRIEHVRRIGVVFGQRTQLWWDLPTIESFHLLQKMYRVPTGRFSESLAELEELLNLAPLLPVPVRQLSLGQRMRCELAASLLHGPEILFLDEPTIGLDAEAKIAVRQFIREYNRRRGMTVILTTHDMDDIEELSHRILVLKEGELIYRGDVDGLRVASGAKRRLTIDTAGDGPVSPLPGVEMHEAAGRLTCLYDPFRHDINEIIARVTSARRIVDLMSAWEPIEEIVARIYREPVG